MSKPGSSSRQQPTLVSRSNLTAIPASEWAKKVPSSWRPALQQTSRGNLEHPGEWDQWLNYTCEDEKPPLMYMSPKLWLPLVQLITVIFEIEKVDGSAIESTDLDSVIDVWKSSLSTFTMCDPLEIQLGLRLCQKAMADRMHSEYFATYLRLFFSKRSGLTGVQKKQLAWLFDLTIRELGIKMKLSGEPFDWRRWLTKFKPGEHSVPGASVMTLDCTSESSASSSVDPSSPPGSVPPMYAETVTISNVQGADPGTDEEGEPPGGELPGRRDTVSTITSQSSQSGSSSEDSSSGESDAGSGSDSGAED